MKILFMGTPDFAAEILNALLKTEHSVVGVVSQPDRPKGRGHKTVPTDVKKAAEAAGCRVFQPETLKDGAIEPLLNELKPDIAVVAAYGKILPEYVLSYPKYGCINVHASLLPKYRGAAPIQRAVIDGETETGVTIMQMSKGLDTGDILSVRKEPITDYETSEELFKRLSIVGGELLLDTLTDIENGKANPKKQDDSKATYAKMLSREDGIIDWTKTTDEIIRLIYGLNSWPLASTLYMGQTLKIVTAVKASGNGRAGEIASIDKGKGMKVYTGDGAIYVETAQFAGSKKMNVEDYARGHELKTGTVLGG